jgi:hypothetical protein
VGVFTLGAFVWLNMWNRCQPGWCGEYGIPFTYYKWSDEIVVLNGVERRPRVLVPALVADISVAVGVATMVAAWASRRSQLKHGAA